jgi:hypothetical protein
MRGFQPPGALQWRCRCLFYQQMLLLLLLAGVRLLHKVSS